MNYLKAFSIALLISSLLLTVHAADNGSPKFSDYSVDTLYTGKPVPVQLKTKDDKMFRTRLQDSETMPISFAGEYAIVTWGCGTGCLFGAAVSHKTGKVHWLPGDGLIQHGKTVWDNDEPLTHRSSSSLIVIYAIRGEEPGENDEGMVHFYSLDEAKGFQFIKSLPKL